jgi:hypothetical protein
MRITIDLPGELLRQAKARAALEGVKLEGLIVRYVQEGLKQGAPAATLPKRQRSELPVARPATGRTLPALNNVDVHRILEEEETSGYRSP